MWKRSIVQESGGSTLELALAVALVVLAVSWGCESADLVIELPAGEAAGQYRLDYRPPQGSPAPNFTVPARASTINFQGLPGTKYHFMLYYSNATFGDLLTWNQTIVTAPEPPANLSVTLGRNKQATITWSPPALGDYTGFRFKVIPLSEREGEARNVTAEAGEWSHTLRELSPGATYQLHAFTLLHDKESAAYASRNFTTKPNTPGKFIVWFRNETTLLVLWQPPYPPGQYTHYKVSIVPPDARDSELYVEKEGEPPGPAQAAFKGLVPGRAYNISVQTVAEPEISAPTTAQYRTVPLRPTEVTASKRNTTSFSVTWREPAESSEFEKYQVSVSGGARRPAPLVLARDDPHHASFDGLEPGAHYSVVVKTMSGKVTSWPATTDVTLSPLPPKDLATRLIENDTEPDVVEVTWSPAEGSTQDSYQVVYHEASSREDSNEVAAAGPRAMLTALLPGRNYTVRVVAVSRDASSAAAVTWAATRPLAPVLREISAQTRALAVAWSSDVNSRQDRYRVTWRRADVPDQPHQTLSTTETRCLVSGLFPGAVYELKVAAVSNGLTSLQHTHLKPIRPLPPLSMTVERASSNSALVRWTLPSAGSSAVGEVVLRYRTAGSWSRLPPLAPDHSEAEIVDMTHGERYTIQLDTASLPADGERQESGEPLTATRTVRPNPVSDVAPLVEERNMTLEWPPPKGRVERYSVWWQGVDPPADQDGDLLLGGQEAGNVTVSQPVSGPARAALSGLWPGAGYRVSIAAHSYNLTSDVFTMDARTRPLIQSEMTIVIESNGSEENDTLPAFIVQYTRTPSSVSTFDTYRFRLEWGGEALVESRAAVASPQRLSFPGLTPGQLYNITMWTVSRAVPSHPVQRQARLFPRPVTRLRAERVAPRDVTLAWDAPPGVWTDFEVQWLADDDELQTQSTHLLQITISGLRPFRNYTFSVGTRAGTPATLLTRATPTSITRATLEAPPSQPSDFQPVDSRPSEVEFAWTLSPRDHNGRLQRFVIQYDEHSQLTFPPDARRGTVSGLTPGAEYTFRLWAETGAGAGAAALWTQRMAIAAPPRPAPSATPALARATTATVAVTFRSDYFSAANGNVTAYTLVVSETPRNDTPLRLPAWRDVRALPLWPPYQVTEPYYPFGTSSVEEFTIGSERCEAGARAYCNGPLKPATKYYVKLRAFTAPDKFTDTAYTVIYTEVDNTAWAAGGGALAALLALGAAAGALLRRRRARPPRAAPPARPARPVRRADFLDHYRIMSADSDFRFSEEFEELKHVGREQPCSAADLPVNRPKNRFTNILPYDHSRFKLQPVDDEEGSDYINANYVPGDTSPREFIVTQGPLHSTRDDFWRMVWESNSRAIVMLTRCIEKGREKCDRYWPADARPAYYGDIAVTALTETRLPEWTSTELCLQRGPDQRRLPHLHFTTWPDFGVPNPPLALARFVRAFRERVPVEAAPRPVVVHCSAGVGRSGTFVCLDRALHQLARNADTLDIFGMVASLRRERVWMVQTEQQYICIHQCVAAVLEGSDLSPPPNNNHHHNQAYEDDEGIAESGM